MGKSKNKTKRLDFDARHVKTKQTVMGRRVQAQETAAGQKRGTAARDNRSSTLLIDLQKQFKNPANVLNDKRASSALPNNNEKMLARWHREKQAMFKQKQRNKKYSLGEDDDDDNGSSSLSTLTHMGRTLGERSEDFNDMPEGYEENHGAVDDDDNAVSYADLLAKGVDSVIARSKIYKAEKAKEKEAHRALGEELDEQWNENLGLIMASKRSRDDDIDDVIRTEVVSASKDGEEDNEDGSDAVEEEEKDDFGDFDSLVKELGTEAKGRASDRMKRPEELAEERVAALEALELDRLRRQRGEDVSGSSEDADRNNLNVRLLLHKDSSEAEKVTGANSNNGGDDPTFKFAVPETLEEWTRMSAGWSSREKELVVRKIVACNHPSMGDGNREKLERFLVVMVEDLVAMAPQKCTREVVDAVAASVLFLARELGGEAAAAAFAPRIRECYEACAAAQKWPGYGEICMLKLCADVFPASDFRHPVTTPALILICACISRAGKAALEGVEDGKDRVASVSGLFMCSLALHYVSQSKRFIPEVFAFVEALVQRLSTLCIPDITMGENKGDDNDNDNGNGNDNVNAIVVEPLPDLSHIDEIEKMSNVEFDRALLLTSINVFARLTKIWLVNNKRNKFMYKIFDRFMEETLEPIITNYSHIAALKNAAENVRDVIATEIGVESEGEEETKGEGEEEEETVGTSSKFPAFRTVERKNPLPAKEFMPKVVEQKALMQRAKNADPSDPAAYREKIKKLKRAVNRERKAVTREIRKDSAYVTQQLDSEARRENNEIRERTGRIMNMLQDQQHQEKVDKRLKERAHKKLRL